MIAWVEQYVAKISQLEDQLRDEFGRVIINKLDEDKGTFIFFTSDTIMHKGKFEVTLTLTEAD